MQYFSKGYIATMKLAIFSLLLLVCLPFVKCNLWGVSQGVIIRGRLLCGSAPAKGILVKLFDKDIGKDDLMASGRTDNEGRFFLNGTENEMGNIDPLLTIFHDCNDGLPCQRKWHWKVPDKYINKKGEHKAVDVGVWNLEVIMKKEHRDCIH